VVLNGGQLCFSLLLKSNIAADLSNHSFLHLYLFLHIIKSLLNDIRRNIEHVIFFLPTSTHDPSRSLVSFFKNNLKLITLKAETLPCPNCIYNQFLPLRVKNSVSIIKTGRLELFRKIIGINYERGVKHINKLYGEMRTFLMLQQLVHIITTALKWP